MEAGKEQAQREFTLRQAETMATIYKEIQGMTARVAKAGDELRPEDHEPEQAAHAGPIRTPSWPPSTIR